MFSAAVSATTYPRLVRRLGILSVGGGFTAFSRARSEISSPPMGDVNSAPVRRNDVIAAFLSWGIVFNVQRIPDVYFIATRPPGEGPRRDTGREGYQLTERI
jgi:hypothetical protein